MPKSILKCVEYGNFNEETGMKGVIEMATERPCVFYRASKSQNIGLGIGQCDLGIAWTICDGDIRFCENPDALIKNLYVKWGRKRKSEGNYGEQSVAKL